MRDYYRDFVLRKSGNAQNNEPTKPTKAPSARFVSSPTVEFAEKATDGYSDILWELDEDQRVIFEERIAIMVYDGGLSETEAIRNLVTNSPNRSKTTE